MRIFSSLIILLLYTSGFSEIRTAFDIGTGKIKMQIAKVKKNRIESLYCRAEKISGSNGSLLNDKGMITEEGQKRIVEVLKFLLLFGESYGSTSCEAIATELFRKAPNGREVAKNISALLGMKIRVISPEEEGILSFLTIVQESKLNPEHIVVLDIGSGSFQITCKIGEQYFVHSVPIGRFQAWELKNNNCLSILEFALSDFDPQIANKIRDCKNIVIGIGAHPKHILKTKTIYDINDVYRALQSSLEKDLNYSDLLFVKTIMEFLSISQVQYLGGYSGNTSGIFVLQTQ